MPLSQGTYFASCLRRNLDTWSHLQFLQGRHGLIVFWKEKTLWFWGLSVFYAYVGHLFTLVESCFLFWDQNVPVLGLRQSLVSHFKLFALNYNGVLLKHYTEWYTGLICFFHSTLRMRLPRLGTLNSIRRNVKCVFFSCCGVHLSRST